MTAVVLRGDARSLPLPDASVDLIVTSPPYYGLRSYTDGGEHYDGQIGSEATPGEWLAALLDCTREWVRVLKPEGSIFVNLGDKFSQRVQVRRSSHQPGIFPGKFPEFGETWAERAAKGATRMPHQNTFSDDGKYVPEKSLLGLPWRYALACTDQLGLILRRDIIWHKPNGLPESVTDRCRSAHEYVFHFTRQPRYYAAVDEIREEHLPVSLKRAMPHRANILAHEDTHEVDMTKACHPLGKLPGSVWSIPSQPLTVPPELGVDHFAAFPMELVRRIILGWSPPGVCTGCGEGRRPVTDKAHTILDTSPDRRSAGSGWPRALTIERGRRSAQRDITGYICACTPHTDHDGTGETAQRRDYNPGPSGYSPQGTYGRKQAGEYERVGPWREYHDDWTPPPARPAVVLDPFGGTGTTALVADALGRHGITIDRSADYCRLARWRTTDPGERARAMQVPKPPPVPAGQVSLFDLDGEAS